MDANLTEAIERVPLLAAVDKSALTVERMGGLTNLVFHVTGPDQDCVLRIPGAGTETYIDRVVELHNARAAADAGVSPEVLFGDADSGIMVTRYVPASFTMTPEAFATRTGAPGRAARAFKQLHGSGQVFRFRFELFAMIDDYLGVLSTKDVALPAGYHDVVAEAEGVRAALDARPVVPVACHCDPLCENFLDTGERMWIVDWEYSGMNDPMWDLGDLSVEGGFDAAQDEEMLRAYFGGEAPAPERARMVIHKAMCDLLWTLWGLIQHADDNPAEDFWAYSTGRFDRCKTLMGDPAFQGHVDAVKNG